MSTMTGGEPAGQPLEQPTPATVALGLEQTVPGPAPSPEPQPAGQPAPAPAPEGAEEGQPVWTDEFRAKYPALATKFTSPDALAGSYANLERYFTAFAQAGLTPEEAVVRLARLNQLETQPGEGTETGETPAVDESGIPDGQEAFLDFMAEDTRGAIEKVVAHQMRQWYGAMGKAQSDWAAAVTKHPDMPQYEQEMQKVLALAPELVKLPDAVERIYFMVKGGASTTEAVNAARADARNETLAQVRSTMVESGRGGASPPIPGAPGRNIVEEIVFAGQGGNAVPALRRMNP